MTNFKEEMEANFGKLTAKQLWMLTKFAKNVRLRCRNNAAFNNFCNGTFGHYASFKQVTKTRPSRYNPSVMESYPGLSISVNGETAEDNDESAE
jgi:hypothetical protein